LKEESNWHNKAVASRLDLILLFTPVDYDAKSIFISQFPDIDKEEIQGRQDKLIIVVRPFTN
jgi:hypothetical protein